MTRAEGLGAPPKTVIAYLEASFETLLRAYYLRHGFEYLDSYLIALLMEVCLASITEMAAHKNHDDLVAYKSTVILLARGIHQQGQSLFLGKMVYHLIKGKLGSAELAELERCLKTENMTEIQSAGLAQVQMEWPVDIVSMSDNPETRRLRNLIKEFQSASIK